MRPLNPDLGQSLSSRKNRILDSDNLQILQIINLCYEIQLGKISTGSEIRIEFNTNET